MKQMSVQDRDLFDSERSLREEHFVHYKHPHPCYAFTAMVLWLFVFIIPIGFLVLQGFSDAAENLELGILQEKLDELGYAQPELRQLNLPVLP